jgi:hypothetical protein
MSGVSQQLRWPQAIVFPCLYYWVIITNGAGIGLKLEWLNEFLSQNHKNFSRTNLFDDRGEFMMIFVAFPIIFHLIVLLVLFADIDNSNETSHDIDGSITEIAQSQN